MAMTFMEAYREAAAVLGGGAGLDLVAGAHESGLLEQLQAPATPDELAERSELPPALLEALTSALTAHGVVEQEGSLLRLTPAWAVLTGAGSLAGLTEILDLIDVEGRLLRGLAGGHDYWSMPAEDRLTYARGISPNPFAPEVVGSFRAAAEQDPDAALLAAGGDYLELGCGVAGRLLSCLQAYPSLRAVGVELAPDLAAEARRRADRLGLAARLEVVEQDAAAFTSDRRFDYAFWSQFFFPTQAREGALRTMLRHLRSGGVAWSPCMTDEDAPADPQSPLHRQYAARRVLFASWGVPERRPAELAAEYEAAGFVEVSVVPSGPLGPPRVRAVRP